MRTLRPGVRGWLAIAAAWTLLTLLSASEAMLALRDAGQPATWGQLLPRAAVGWYTCAVFTPLLVWAVNRWPIDASQWRAHVPRHLLLVAAVAWAKFALEWLIRSAVTPGATPPLGDLLRHGFITENLILWAVVGALHAVGYAADARARERDLLRLETQLTTARLERLSAQLQPHFLFNTLQAISTLLHRDAARADRMLGELGNLLRASMTLAPQQEVALRDELKLATAYLTIAGERLGARVAIHRDIADDVLGAAVPTMLLQPLLENAVEHGLASHTAAGMLRLAAHRRGAQLVLRIDDDGPGVRMPLTEGVGLGATRARLQTLHGGAAALSVTPRDGGGTRTEVTLPFRLVAS
ncbi:MAG: histidine kinase [Gemmatimonadetes bacterium]|nr:histidine kinase [Gemmatimonadota bacterium]